ncbi:hypothetical protein RIF29_07450 [Crotalaria pallida]|uniref:Clp R domain-containing protein n=1 Tax=Crotalaria pallida TaxID=3830 RepID=A0AAN9J4G6_CROPI
MRAGLSTIQQTLTPEAASVLNHSIAEAGRRNHGQTTPLHVAATLLSSPSGFLRQACIKSHPNSSHPLQCRALELCFSVALERLPTSQNTSPSSEPPISNALMAALKRAQAHQRRGYPEQQQQPLLAVKVELEQLIISILDDPSVSRVMREASFSSPAVKATIEQSINSAPSNSNPIGLGFRPSAMTMPAAAPPGRSLYLNPRLQQGSGGGGGAGAIGGAGTGQLGQVQRGEEVKKVVDILMRRKKRNPILVGESEPEAAIKEVLRKIENKELGEAGSGFGNAHVIHLEKELPSDRAQVSVRLKELGDLIESRVGNSGVFVDLGDLKWLVEQPVGFGVGGGLGNKQQLTAVEAGRAAVVEMARLVAKFGEAGAGKLWLLGTATCETYLRCQVYHPSMENDWDLQAVPITTRAPMPGMFPRLGNNGILGTSLDSLSPLKAFPTTTITPPWRASENIGQVPAGVSTCCPQCMRNCEKEVAEMLKENEKSDSEFKSEAACPTLPQWLQDAKTNNDNDKVKDQSQSKSQEDVKKRTQELQKKWHDSCLNLHPKFHQQHLSTERITPTPFSMTGLYNVSLMGRQFQPKIPLNKNLGTSLQLNSNSKPTQPPPEQVVSQRPSLVTTELVLGQTKPADAVAEETQEQPINDLLGCLSQKEDKFDELQNKKLLDADSFKKLLKCLTEKVWWQHDAASAVATTVTQCKVGNGKRRQLGTKGDMWLLFLGPDRVGKKKMAAAVAELVNGSNPTIISLAQRRGDGDSDVHFRGKTVLDRIAEAIRRNPHSIIMLEDIDEANTLIRGSIKRAMEQGRFPDTHGREISLGNVMFILTANWLPEDLRYLSNGNSLDEEKLSNSAKGGWQLRLSVGKKASKRRPSWLTEEDRSLKPRKETNSSLSFDLNEAADADEEDKADGSLNSSDLTVDHEDNHVLHNEGSPSKIPRDLLDSVDDAIVFKPLNFNLIRRNFATSITKRFSTVVGNFISIEVKEEALEKIACGVWLGQTSLDEWMEKVLVPSFHQLKKNFNSSTNDNDSSLVVRLEEDGCSDRRNSEEWLPATVRVVAEEYYEIK